MRQVAALAVVLGLGHLVYAGLIELVEDEAYYWVWSQQLGAGYLDHPPAIAWVIRAGTEIFGDTERGVRAGGAILGALALLPLAHLGKAPLQVALVLATMPLLALGGVLATPDVPLLAAWALGLWAADQRRWLLFGLACGLAMLSKYTGVLLWPLVMVALREELRTRGPWLAAGVATLVYLPNALWNLAHDSVSWRFQLDHVAEAGRPLEVLGAQVGLAGPVIFGVIVAWWCVGWRGDRRERLAWWTSLPVLLIAVVAGGEANWAAPAWLGAAVGLGQRAGRIRRGVHVGIGVNAVLCAVVLVHAVHPLVRLPVDPTDRLHGGKILADSVAAWGVQEVVCSRYQEAALIHFYSGVPAVAIPGWSRADQYDLWDPPMPPRGLFVRVWRADAPTAPDKLGYDRGGPNVVSAYVNVPGEDLMARPIARWQVYEYWPMGEERP